MRQKLHDKEKRSWSRRAVVAGIGLAGLPVAARAQAARSAAAPVTASEFLDLSAAVAQWELVGGTLQLDRDFDISLPITMIARRGLSYHLITDGPRLLRYVGPRHHWALCIYSEGETPFRIEGNLTIDGTNRVAMPFFARFENVSGELRRDFRVRGLACRNAKIVNGTSGLDGTPANSYGASGMLFSGGFDRLHLSDVSVKDVTRAAGSGIPGSKGSLGIGVTGNLQSTSSARHVTIEDFEVCRIDSEDSPLSPERVDMDGVLVFQAAEEGGTRPVIQRGTIREAAGRSVKVFAPGGGGVTRELKIFRSISSRYYGSVDINHQHGDGLIADIEISYAGRAHDLPTTSISMSSGTARAKGFPFAVGEVRNIRIHDTTGRPKGALVGLQYNVVGDTSPRRYLFSHIIDDGVSRSFFLPGALGTHGPATIIIEDVDVGLSESLFASEDPTQFLRVQARRAHLSRGRELPVKVNYSGRPVPRNLDVRVNADASVSGLHLAD